LHEYRWAEKSLFDLIWSLSKEVEPFQLEEFIGIFFNFVRHRAKSAGKMNKADLEVLAGFPYHRPDRKFFSSSWEINNFDR
jgi:hypothetical protein